MEKLSELLGGVDKLFSKRAMKYRQMGLHEMTLDDNDMRFIEGADMFFIATADELGRPNCSYKGGDPAEWPEHLRVREFPEVRRAA